MTGTARAHACSSASRYCCAAAATLKPWARIRLAVVSGRAASVADERSGQRFGVIHRHQWARCVRLVEFPRTAAGQSVAMTGAPHAMASTSALGNPSQRELRTKAPRPAPSGQGIGAKARHVDVVAKPGLFRLGEQRARSGPSPRITSRQSIRARVIAKARKQDVEAFCCVKPPGGDDDRRTTRFKERMVQRRARQCFDIGIEDRIVDDADLAIRAAGRIAPDRPRHLPETATTLSAAR